MFQVHKNMPRSDKWPMGNVLKDACSGCNGTTVQAKLITDVSTKSVNLQLSYPCLLQRRRERRSELLKLKVIRMNLAVKEERMLAKGDKSEYEVMDCRLITHGNESGGALQQEKTAGTNLRERRQIGKGIAHTAISPHMQPCEALNDEVYQSINAWF